MQIYHKRILGNVCSDQNTSYFIISIIYYWGICISKYAIYLFFLVLSHILFILRMCLYVCEYMCTMVKVWMSEDILRELFSSFYCVVPWTRTQVLRLDGQCLYPRRHPASPSKILDHWIVTFPFLSLKSQRLLKRSLIKLLSVFLGS